MGSNFLCREREENCTKRAGFFQFFSKQKKNYIKKLHKEGVGGFPIKKVYGLCNFRSQQKFLCCQNSTCTLYARRRHTDGEVETTYPTVLSCHFSGTYENGTKKVCAERNGKRTGTTIFLCERKMALGKDFLVFVQCALLGEEGRLSGLRSGWLGEDQYGDGKIGKYKNVKI